MKKVKINQITLLSVTEKKGRIIKFEDGFNIILGENDTGKSSLLKSIYYAFGAETRMHPVWKSLNPIIIIEFDYDFKSYTILRDKNHITVYDSDLNILNISESITKDFAPFFSDLFDFKIDLTNSKKDKIQATPAFALLPFYVDQDLGWAKNWGSFDNLAQFNGWRNDIVSFHTGSRPSQYYRLKSEKDKLKEKRKVLESEREILQSIYDKFIKNFEEINLDISFDDFKEEIEKLLEDLNEIKKDIELSRENLKELYNHKHIVKEQLTLTERSLNEIRSDYKFCVDKLESEVACPTCGATYTNSFAERFSIAKDEESCLDLYQELKSELSKINKKIDKTIEQLLNKTERQKHIEEILKTKKEQITLKELIDYTGKKNVLEILNLQIKSKKEEISKIILEMNDIENKIKEIDDPEKKKAIIEDYRKNMGEFLDELNVENLSFDTYKGITSNIKESGSDQPRALLSYYFSILNIIYNTKNNNTLFPIIIDAPKQQEQDEANEKRILEFIKNKSPKNAQLFLGIVNLDGVNFDANIINLKDKNSLLKKEEYSPAFDYYRKLVSKQNSHIS